MMHNDDDNNDDELMILSYDDDKKMRVKSMMIIDNHVTVIEIVTINGGHKLAVMAAAVIKLAVLAPTIMAVAATRYVTVQPFSHLEYGTIILNLSTVFNICEIY